MRGRGRGRCARYGSNWMGKTSAEGPEVSPELSSVRCGCLLEYLLGANLGRVERERFEKDAGPTRADRVRCDY